MDRRTTPFSVPLLGILSFLVFSLLLAWVTFFGVSANPVIKEVLSAEGSDKLGHLAIYGALTASAIWTTGDIRLSSIRWIPLWPGVVFAISVADELRQIAEQARSFEVNDLMANGVGITLGWGIGRILRALSR